MGSRSGTSTGTDPARVAEPGRVGPHPVNRHSPKLAARSIETDEDVREVIALMRLNYDRVVGEERTEARR